MNCGNPGMDRKRKMDGEDWPIPRKNPRTSHGGGDEEEENIVLTLSLSSSVQQHHPAPPPQQRRLPLSGAEVPSPRLRLYINPETGTSPAAVYAAPPPRQSAARRNTSKATREGKSETIPPPFPWSTDARATVQSLSYLRSKQINLISGDAQCKKCGRQLTMNFNLEKRFEEIKSYIDDNKVAMSHRAPRRWMSPNLPGCKFCGNENCIRPVISDKKRSINWLFFLLGEMLGLLTLDQLKYFCKHSKNHRTGAKDRLLFLTYLGLCKQLDPAGPFDIP